MLRLMRAEWLKITRMGTSRALAAILLALAILLPLTSVVSVLGNGTLKNRQAEYNQLSFPSAIGLGISAIQNIGVLLVVVLVATVIGSEYSLDTWKNLLTRQTGRGRFLLAKLAVAGPLLIVGFVVMALLNQVLGLFGQAMVADTAAKAGLVQTTMTADQFWTGIFSSGVPLLFYFGVVAAVATLCTVVGRSTVAGILVTMALWIADNFAVRLLPDSWSNFTVAKNVNSLKDNLLQSGTGSIETWQSVTLFGVLIVVPLIVALFIFRQRDMAG